MALTVVLDEARNTADFIAGELPGLSGFFAQQSSELVAIRFAEISEFHQLFLPLL